MNGCLELRILIVEDDDSAHEGMEATLQREATLRDMHVVTARATALVEAKRLWKDYNPHLVATDMNYPFYVGEEIRSGSGAHLVSYIRRRGAKIPVIVYSSGEIDESTQSLADADLDKLPLILKKDTTVGHEAWAKAALDLLR
jgi:CheY-like chemotaxis protein